MEEIAKPLQNVFVAYVNPVLNQPLAVLGITYIVILTAVFSAEELPLLVKNLLTSPIMRFLVVLISVYSQTGKAHIALLVSVGMITVFYGMSSAVEHFELISPETDTMPGCVNVTVKDLLELFEGDEDKLKKTMYASGVPVDLRINDRNAPLISTYLVNFGNKVTESCRAPN